MLIGLLVLMIVATIFVQFSYREKFQVDQIEIQKNKEFLENLQVIARSEDKADPEDSIFLKKSFATYEEVVPFIAFLESLFSAVDPDAEIIIKSRENQIFINHFADYTIHLEINENKNLLLKAFEELEDSRFITATTNFNIDYKPTGDENLNKLTDVELTVRLFLK